MLKKATTIKIKQLIAQLKYKYKITCFNESKNKSFLINGKFQSKFKLLKIPTW
ncbi:hypothetical protein SDAV_00946 [Spiroplasma phoeniceum P40]|uniref:Uncharacterized protein n=1 Tax=Spiroplasma phoeniceum P40 TaxID=1276259 RepID=A0A345DNY8_9MOLU|nr:hypothetical protein SDAV_00946 [Spiroplasma phoeniceum P40]